MTLPSGRTENARTPSRHSPVRHAIVNTHGVADPLESFWREDALETAPLPYETWLEDALECLFRPVEAGGFWDDDAQRLVRGLRCERRADGDLEWTPDRGTELRSTPFASMGLLQWRTSSIGEPTYDDQLYWQLEYVRDLLADDVLRDRLPTYALGSTIDALVRASEVFGEQWLGLAIDCFESSRDCAFDHAEDGLLLAGWATLAERTGDAEIETHVSDALDLFLTKRAPSGLLEFSNRTTRRHPDQQFACWGISRAAAVTDRPGALRTVENVLEYTLEHRLRPDGSFRSEDVPFGRRLAWRALEFGPLEVSPRHWQVLTPYHQTLFVNTVATYAGAGGTRSYDGPVEDAMRWLVSGNPLESDLFEASGLGVPIPAVTIDGRVDVSRNRGRCVGAYEIGSLVAALTQLLTGPTATSESVNSESNRLESEADRVASPRVNRP